MVLSPGRLPAATSGQAGLPPGTEVVAYCRGEYYCVLAHEAVRLLNALGRRAVRLTDGMLEGRLSELPVDTEAAA
ncbi:MULTISPECIES: hypothetical protein [unclassified Streptomyces]|uniref:hypothetical protein n=1 Tax=unclassified Streptomyces TaxID=2593676 RepID=UPI002E0EA49B|nr:MULTISPECIES: hypothetical protein [unclassified Streptomyces]WSR22819.1 hypothetical protein OG573_29265 [Streptomyces sp. NBC_01205]